MQYNLKAKLDVIKRMKDGKHQDSYKDKNKKEKYMNMRTESANMQQSDTPQSSTTRAASSRIELKQQTEKQMPYSKYNGVSLLVR